MTWVSRQATRHGQVDPLPSRRPGEVLVRHQLGRHLQQPEFVQGSQLTSAMCRLLHMLRHLGPTYPKTGS